MRRDWGRYDIVKPWRLILLAILIGPGAAGICVGLEFELYLTALAAHGQAGLEVVQIGLFMSVLAGVLFGYGFGIGPTVLAMLLAFLILPLKAITPLRFWIVFMVAGIAAGALAVLAMRSAGLHLDSIAGLAVPAVVPAVAAIWYLAKWLRLVVPSVSSLAR